MKITRLFTATLYFAVLFSPTWATGEGKKNWGYERDSQSRARYERALRLLDQASPVSLSPDSNSDVVLSSFVLAKDESGLRSISMQNPLNAQTHDLFWFVDTRAGTYRTFRMTWDINADASRLHPFIQQQLPSGTTYSLTRMKQAIAQVYSMKLEQTADLAERNARFYPVCWGGGHARIVAYDPLVIELVETDAWAAWRYDGTGAYYSNGGGYCWANPEVQFQGITLSHWYVDTCLGDLQASSYSSRSRTHNKSYNDDFGDDDERTWFSKKLRFITTRELPVGRPSTWTGENSLTLSSDGISLGTPVAVSEVIIVCQTQPIAGDSFGLGGLGLGRPGFGLDAECR